MYELIKTIHIITVIIFVGTVFFRTFVLFKLNKEFTKEESKKIQDFLRNEARKIVAINNIVLILTGLILFFTYWQHAPIILHIKATLGIVLVIAFFFIPKILNYFNAKQESRIKIHYLYFSLLLITVALSQYIYF